MERVKATIDIPDDLYRRVKAKSAMQGLPVREVAIRLFRSWVEGGEAQSPTDPSAESADEPPVWFGSLRRYAGSTDTPHDMESIRQSIARRRSRPRKKSR